jgi:hypothetical protein
MDSGTFICLPRPACAHPHGNSGIQSAFFAARTDSQFQSEVLTRRNRCIESAIRDKSEIAI